MIIFFGIIVILAAIGVYFEKKYMDELYLAIFASAGIFVSIIVSCFFTIGGYKDLEVSKEYDLLPISSENKDYASTSYLLFTDDNQYIYKYKVNESSNDASSNNETYKITTLQKKLSVPTKVIEQENCESPKMIVYNQKPKFMGLFTLSRTKISYCFVIPKGSLETSNPN